MITTIISFVLGNKAIAGLVGMLMALVGVWFAGGRSAKAKMKAKRLKATLKAHKKRNEIEDKVARKSNKQNKEELKKWSRE